METLILMVDTGAIFMIVLFSLRNQRRPQDSAEFGPFRIKPARPPQPTKATAPASRGRNRSL